jgi:aconitate hydratase
VRANYLASPMLVVAYALAGRVDIDLTREPIGRASDGHPVLLKELWPSAEEVRAVVEKTLDPALYTEKYRRINEGESHWEHLPSAGSAASYPWDPKSTYLRLPPYFSLPAPPAPAADGTLIAGARALAVFGDRVSTDHISPAGEIPVDSPAGRYLVEHGVDPSDFNTYGTRRGNHEVLVRGTFANVRLKNALAGGREGGYTAHQPDGAAMTIYDASLRYASEGVPLVVLAGAAYGQGSSRDWAAKGPRLLGVRAVVAKSFERIHRGNLVGMGVLPLTFRPGEGVSELGLSGRESFSLRLPAGRTLEPRGAVQATALAPEGRATDFTLECRIDHPVELGYYRAGGILPYVLDRLAHLPAAGVGRASELPKPR